MPEYLLRVVIPAHNEAGRIGNTIVEYCSYFENRGRIVIVANGCSDATEDVVRGFQDRFENLALVSIPGRIGKGGAVRVGLASGDEPVVGFTDADGSTSASEFDRLARYLDACGLDAVLGSRWMDGSIMRTPQPLARRVASRGFNFLVRVFFGLTFYDTQCGAKVFRRRALDTVLPRLELANFAFDIDILRQLRMKGASCAEIPIEWGETFVGSQVRLIPASLSMFAAILRLRLRDSVVARLPFFDYLARASVIPVRQQLRILILSRREPSAAMEAFIRFLQFGGHEVRWLVPSGAGSWAQGRVLFWYAVFARSQYDAVLEVASARPFYIPAFSVKAKFLFDAPHGVIADAHYRRYYRNVPRIAPFDRRSAPEVAARILQEIKSGSAYLALFDQQDGNWSLHYTDAETGAARRERL